MRIASRVSELSLHGCYLDMMNPFPMGTMVLVKIAAGDAFFEARSKIIYSQPNMGAGVGFLQIAPGSQAVLERWLDGAEKDDWVEKIDRRNKIHRAALESKIMSSAGTLKT